MFYIQTFCFEDRGTIYCAIPTAAFPLFCFEPLYLQELEIQTGFNRINFLFFSFKAGWLFILLLVFYFNFNLIREINLKIIYKIILIASVKYLLQECSLFLFLMVYAVFLFFMNWFHVVIRQFKHLCFFYSKYRPHVCILF